jgi:hypothetical protein
MKNTPLEETGLLGNASILLAAVIATGATDVVIQTD